MLWIGTSWKMNKTLAQARAFVDLLAGFAVPAGIQPFVLPAHTALAAVRDRLPADSPVLLGAQNAHWAPEGAGTGEVSMRMVADAGARMVELGHSERREQFGETDETVSLKVEAALAGGLIPLVCVGEPREVRDAGDSVGFVTAQVRAALSRLDPAQIGAVLIAYEPVWAIGEHGRPATPAEVDPVMREIGALTSQLGQGDGARRVLYGGSVDHDNAAALLDQTCADGLFVGRAAWDADGYIDLLRRCAANA